MVFISSVNNQKQMGNQMKALKKSKPKSQYKVSEICNPQESQFYNEAKIKEKQGDYETAIMIFNKSLQINPCSALAYNGLGNCQLRLGQIELAKQNYLKAIELDPKCKYAYNALGIVYELESSYQMARECFQKAIHIDSNFYFPYNSLGNQLYFRGNYTEALSFYEKAIKIQPSNSLMHANLACCYLMLERYEQAFGAFLKVKKHIIKHKADLSSQNLHYIEDKLDQFKVNICKTSGKHKSKFIEHFKKQMEKKSQQSTISLGGNPIKGQAHGNEAAPSQP